MEQEFHEARGAQTIDRAASLLVGVLEEEQPRSVTDLAAAAGLPKSTTSRLLSALERNGLVEQDGNRGAFRPGPALVRFAHRGLAGRNLVELAQESLAELSELSGGETINLAVAGPEGVEHLAQIDSRHILGAGQWLGRPVAPHCSANGKVLLAFGALRVPAPEKLEPLTPRTVTSAERLAEELERVRADGYAVAVDELELGLTAMAAPVTDESGAVIAALSITGPTLRLPDERVAELAPALIEQSLELSRRLGNSREGKDAA